ncbi:MAG: lipoyl(octanoyl) transferase LipB [Acidimicrobiia bacterium]|nr:lipoyl(octanoyl) transferase LipB [Acidimicrobiia bacterium]
MKTEEAVFPALSSESRLGQVEECLVWDLGWQDYASSLELQRKLVGRRKRHEIGDCLLFVEYPHVITLGRGGKAEHLLAGAAELECKSVGFYDADRGGDITYHGPGQMISYPILDLKGLRRDIGWYLRGLEQSIIDTLVDFGLQSRRVAGATGVWVGDDKIAAIGVRTSQWVTSHGIALNVSTDLAYFDLIVPCGLQSRGVTSLARLLGSRTPPLQEVKSRFTLQFGRVFGRSTRETFSEP